MTEWKAIIMEGTIGSENVFLVLANDKRPQCSTDPLAKLFPFQCIQLLPTDPWTWVSMGRKKRFHSRTWTRQEVLICSPTISPRTSMETWWPSTILTTSSSWGNLLLPELTQRQCSVPKYYGPWPPFGSFRFPSLPSYSTSFSS